MDTTPLASNPVTIFLVVMGIILIVPLVFQRLKVPYIIGLIIAGVAIGPYGFNVVARDMSFQVFGQVGLLYLMFLAGLEIDLFNLRKNLHKGAVFGAYTFIIPLVAGFLVGRFLLNLDSLAAMLLAAMFAAHTLLAYPVAARYGLKKSTPVVIAIAGTIVAVVGALIVLAAVGSIAKTGTFSPLTVLSVVAKVALFCVAIVYLYPRLTRWFFKRHSDKVMQFIYIMAVTFLAAAVARWIDIEGVFGAFFAGLVMNRFVPSRSPLMARLEFVGNAIFIPYFLIGVGMLLDLRVITQGYTTLYVAAVMTTATIATKWLAAAATQLTFSLKAVDRSMIYQLSNAHTAVALAVVTIGYQMHLLDETVLNATVIMILVTCTVSIFGAERASRRLKIIMLESGIPENNDANRKPRVLLTVSNPITTPQLVDLALLMRGDSNPDALFGLYVRTDNSPASIAVGRNALEVAEQNAAAVDLPLTSIERYDLNVVTGLLNTIAERDVNELIIGMHRRTGIVDSFFGSKIEQLLASTNRMITISRCFIPVNTVTKIIVYIPAHAEYETGFRRCIEALASLSREIGCRILFYAAEPTIATAQRLMSVQWKGLRSEFIVLDSRDDYVMLPGKIGDDDLFVVVSARRASLSFDPVLDELPAFLQRWLSRNNLIVIYPEQFGQEPQDASMAQVMSPDITSTPVSLWLKLRLFFRRLRS